MKCTPVTAGVVVIVTAAVAPVNRVNISTTDPVKANTLQLDLYRASGRQKVRLSLLKVSDIRNDLFLQQLAFLASCCELL